jgi:non-specific serine/threonine protein kinase
MQGDLADAIPALEEAERLFRYIGDLPGTAFARLLQGEIRLFQGDEGTQSLLEESLELIRSLGNAALTAYPLKNLGHLARLQGDHDRADVLLQEALACSRDAAHGWGIADALNSLAEVAIQRGDLRSAARYLGEALPLYWDVKDTFCIAIALGDLAVVSRMNGQPEQAARLLGAEEALRERIGSPPWWVDHIEYEEAAVAARASLGEDAFAVAWAAGRALPLAEVVAEAVDIASALASPRPEPTSGNPAAEVGLSNRELDVLRLVAAGRSDKAIGEALFISHRTATTHVSHILAKLGVQSRTEAAAWALQHGVA